MGFFEALFEIVEEKECPMYNRGDCFKVSGLSLSSLAGKPTCLFLAREITEYMLKRLGEEQFAPSKKGRTAFNCSGCTGLIKFQLKEKEEQQFTTMHMRMLAATEKKPNAGQIESLSSMLGSFSLFQVIDDDSLKDLLTHLQIKEYRAGQHIINKGDEGNFLYMILTGKVEVVDNDRTIAYLGRGEIFGEMSMLTGKPVGATIKVVEQAKIISISNEQFRLILIKYPSVQLGVTKILARRLNDSNLKKDGASGANASFSGSLKEVPVAEICQLLNSNTKTGVISLQVSKGRGQVRFMNGQMVKVDYNGYQGQDAFFALLREKTGEFSYKPGLSDQEKRLAPIGSFMGLLMEGLQKIDEEKAANG